MTAPVIKPRNRVPESERSPRLRWYYRNRESELASKKGKSVYRPEWFRANRERYTGYTRQRRAIIREALNWYKRTQGCADCGETDPIVLDFDHVRGKKSFTISDTRRKQCWSLPCLWDEVQKCEVVCSNCHRRRSARRRDA